MTGKKLLGILVVLAIALLSTSSVAAQEPAPPKVNETRTTAGTAFTYQGQLKHGGGLANGFYDFQFRLYDALADGSQVGGTVTVEDQQVTDGLFAVNLDFGSGIFNGEARYLEIGVRSDDGEPYATLSPRQMITPAPYALALPGLWTQPNDTSPNLIGGYSENIVAPEVVGASIGGGGAGGASNRVLESYGTVGGGLDNSAGGPWAVVGGGLLNNASGDAATVSGGYGGTAGDYATVAGGIYNEASGRYAAVGGGDDNLASGISATVGGGGSNQALADYATIAGGGSNAPESLLGNRVTDNHGSVGGGANNQAGNSNDDPTDAAYATVGGGADNTASGEYTAIGGGEGNTATHRHATVGGGWRNTADYNYTTVGGGIGNTASGDSAVVGGGYVNTASGSFTTVAGGYVNTASGRMATVGGGYENVAAGDFSFAAGHQARAAHTGTFVWSDAAGGEIATTGDNQFVAQASGGVWFYSDADATTGVRLPAGSGAWASLSDREAKANFASVDGRDILARLAAVPVQTWNYKSQAALVRHMGPTAQDFYAAFGLGEDDKHISTVDADGVALAAVQALYEMVQERDARIAAQQESIEALEVRLAALERAGNRNAALSSLIPSTHHAIFPPLLWSVSGGLLIAGLVLDWRRRRGNHG